MSAQFFHSNSMSDDFKKQLLLNIPKKNFYNPSSNKEIFKTAEEYFLSYKLFINIFQHKYPSHSKNSLVLRFNMDENTLTPLNDIQITD